MLLRYLLRCFSMLDKCYVQLAGPSFRLPHNSLFDIYLPSTFFTSSFYPFTCACSWQKPAEQETAINQHLMTHVKSMVEGKLLLIRMINRLFLVVFSLLPASHLIFIVNVSTIQPGAWITLCVMLNSLLIASTLSSCDKLAKEDALKSFFLLCRMPCWALKLITSKINNPIRHARHVLLLFTPSPSRMKCFPQIHLNRVRVFFANDNAPKFTQVAPI